jgi:hypothetical protein
VTPSAIDPIQEPNFRATGEFDDARLNVRLWGNADQRGNTLLDSFLQAVDLQAVAAGVKDIVVDFRELEFMNSSCLKALVTWLRRAREHAPEQRYAIRFVHEPQAHWQIRSFSALAAFGRGVLTIE